MPSSRQDTKNIDHQDPRYVKLAWDDSKSLIRVTSDGHHVQIWYQSEPEIQNMKKEKEEQENTRQPLKEVEPISGIAVTEHIWLGLGRDHDAVYRVEQKRNKNPHDLDK